MKGPGWYIILFVILVSFTIGTGVSRPPGSPSTQTPPITTTYTNPPQYSNLDTPPKTEGINYASVAFRNTITFDAPGNYFGNGNSTMSGHQQLSWLSYWLPRTVIPHHGI